MAGCRRHTCQSPPPPPPAFRTEEGVPGGRKVLTDKMQPPSRSLTIQQKKYHKGCVSCPATTPTDKPTSSPSRTLGVLLRSQSTLLIPSGESQPGGRERQGTGPGILIPKREPAWSLPAAVPRSSFPALPLLSQGLKPGLGHPPHRGKIITRQERRRVDLDSQVSHSSSHSSGKVTREGVGLDPSDQALGRQQGAGGSRPVGCVRVCASSLGPSMDGHALCAHALRGP